MAQGARKVSHADYALSVTGIAGPDGGSAEKPVGLTYIGLAGPGGVEVARHQFTGDRGQNRISAAQTALNMLRLHLLNSMN
jgi:nicotinamide-nucleotide amidase